MLGFAFSGAFVIAELLRMTFFGPPVPTAVIGGTEQLSRLFFQYYEQAVARPWLSVWPILAALLGGPIAAASWRVGTLLGRFLANDLHPEALAHS